MNMFSPPYKNYSDSSNELLKISNSSVRTENRTHDISRVDMSDISMGEERHQLSVMSKATAISPLVCGVTIGPDTQKTSPINSNYGCILWREEESERSNLKLPSQILKAKEEKTFRNNTTGVIEKLLYELEEERKAEVHHAMRVRLEKLESQAREREKETKKKQANLKCEADGRADLERLQAQRLQQEQEYEENQRQANLALAQEKRTQLRMQLIKEANQQAEESRKQIEVKNIFLNKMKEFEKTFYLNYKQLLECIRSCKDLESLQSSSSSSLQMVKNLNASLVPLLQQCSAVGEVSSSDLQAAAAIIQQFDICRVNIEECVKNINEKFYENCAKEKELNQKEENKPISKPSTLPTTNASDAITLNSSSDNTSSADDKAMQLYANMKVYLAEFQASLSTITQDIRLKEFKFNCKKAVVTPVNAISDANASHLYSKLQRLTCLLLGESINLDDCRFSAKSHPQGIAFCMDLLCAKLVSQGRTTVSSKSDAAFPLAALIVSLWAEFPEFGKLLLAHFYQACPYLVPVYLPQLEGQSKEDYLKILGYRYDDAGKVEKQDQFLKKMSGIMRLYAAITVTPLRRQQQQRYKHPHGISEAWRWITGILNLEPFSGITATLLLDFLEVAGSTLAATYGIQFQKLLHIFCKDYFHRIQKIDERSGPASRLEVFLQNVLKSGSIPKPPGMPPPNFW